MKPEILNDFLDATEQVAIQMFVDNERMREAVKKVLLWEIYQNGTLKRGEAPTPLRNSFIGVAMTADDPTKIGQRVMAIAEGINYLEIGFKHLSQYGKKEEKVGSSGNQSR